MSYVVDASVAIKWFVPKTFRTVPDAVRSTGDMEAPDFLIAEVEIAWKKAMRKRNGLAGNVPGRPVIPSLELIDDALSIALQLRHLSPDQAQFIEQANKRCIQHIYASSEFSERASSIALHIDHKVYDCVYLACAEANGSILVSADKT